MSCVETGYVLKDYANYMIASQETILAMSENHQLLVQRGQYQYRFQHFLIHQYCKNQTHIDLPNHDLILWDHGGGSILGYGYDEVYNSTLKLKDIKTALENSPFSKEYMYHHLY